MERYKITYKLQIISSIDPDLSATFSDKKEARKEANRIGEKVKKGKFFKAGNNLWLDPKEVRGLVLHEILERDYNEIKNKVETTK